MPRFGERGLRRLDVDEAERLAELAVPAGWRRSRRGNLWRELDGLTLTVFARAGAYAWCVAGEDGPRFSRDVHETEAAAVRAVLHYLDYLDANDEGDLL